MWFFLALLSAVLGGVRRSSEKRLLSNVNHFTLGWAVQVFSLPVCLAVLFVSGSFLNPLQLGLGFWLPLLLVVVVFYPVNTWLFYKALKEGELSKVLPVQSLMPVFSLVLAWLLVGEVPTIVAVCGVLLICIGLYILNMNGKKPHNPLQPFLEDKSTLYMLGSTLAVALVAPLDKIAINASNPLFYTAISTAGAAGMLYVIARYFKQDDFELKKNWRSLTGIGLLQGSAYATFIVALSLGPVAYVNATKSSGILFGALAGVLFLKESFTRTKLISFVLIAAGLSVLALQ